MLSRLLLLLAVCSIPALASADDTSSSLWIEAEAAAVWQTKNEVQIPSDTGTRFSLVPLGKGPLPAGRILLGYRFNPRHEVRALYAPLTLKLSGRLDSDVSYQNELFSGSADTDASYTFNSYRLTYRFVFQDDDKWTLRVGFTGKIRDAEIKLTQGTKSASRSNVGFVPLLHFSGTYHMNDVLKLNFDMDALAAPQGRAEDVALMAGYRLSPRTEARLGYRTVEGGANGGGGVYNFTWLHYAVVGIQHEI